MVERSIQAITKAFLAAVLLAGLFVSPVSAWINVGAGGLHLGYGNGTYTLLGMGTYSNISRLDNVWYIDGVAYPSGVAEFTAEDLLGIGVVFGIILFCMVFALIWIRKE